MRRTNTISLLKNLKPFFHTLLFFIGLPLLSLAQGWERDFGGQWQDGGHALLQTTNGDYLIAGYSNSLTAGDNDIYLVKTDAAGNELWSKTYGGPGIDEALFISQAGSDYIIAGHTGGPTLTDNNIYMLRVDSNGNTIWEKSIGDNFNQECGGLAVASDGSIFLAGTDNHNVNLHKFDTNGTSIWVKEWTGIDSSAIVSYQGQHLAITPDNHLGMLVDANVRQQQLNVIAPLYKMDLNGDTLWTRQITSSSSGKTTLIATQNNGFAISGNNALEVINSAGDITQTISYTNASFLIDKVNTVQETVTGGFVVAGNGIARFNTNGSLEWSVLFDNSNLDTYEAHDILQTSDGGFTIAGESFWQLNTPAQATLLHTDANGNIYTSFAQGNVFLDEIDNCLKDPTETGLLAYKVKATGSKDFYAITDSLGNYLINLDSGAYDLSVISNSPYIESCNPTYPIQINMIGDTVEQTVPMEILIECPAMNISMSTARLRRCFNSFYYIDYCNFGSISGDNAYATIELDTFLTLINSSIPFTGLGNNLYQFDLGDVGIGECGNFNLEVYVSCDAILGQTHCSTALIFPDTICSPPPSNWSGASVAVRGECTPDSVKFTLKNIGNGNMATPLNYIVIEDVVMYMAEPFQLLSGDSINTSFPTNGATYQMVAAQVEGHPGNSNPLAAIEGCATDSNTVISTGFIGMLPLDENNPTIDIDCTANIGSYDPNDKQGFPAGYSDDHLIKPNTSLDYLIRFQNTGTDTAFTVLVRDTLSGDLEMESFQVLNSSHPYELRIEQSNILVFTFNNIHLPDSNVNEAASHGFVKFKIGQKLDLPDGTLILNQAGIYFDFNEPIITNQTSHLISRNFLDLVPIIEHPEYGQLQFKVFPNPSSATVYIEIEGLEELELQFNLYDLSGRLISQQNFENGRMTLERNKLQSGLYIYRIEHDGLLINSGKLILH